MQKPHTVRNISKIYHNSVGLLIVTDDQINQLLHVTCCVDLDTRSHC